MKIFCTKLLLMLNKAPQMTKNFFDALFHKEDTSILNLHNHLYATYKNFYLVMKDSSNTTL